MPVNFKPCTGQWIVGTKGGHDLPSFEIFVARRDNRLAFDSYGWYGADKLLITHNGGPCNWPIDAWTWYALLEVAQRKADYLNFHETHP